MKITAAPNPLAVPGLDSITTGLNGQTGFSKAVADAIDQVETYQHDAKTAAANLLGSGQGDVYQVALAGQRADLALELFQQVRNKFVQAYQEIMRMQM